MRLVFIAPVLLLAACAPGPAGLLAGCEAQGFAPGTEGYRHCQDAGGVAIATGPGSPYAWWADGEESQ